MRELTATGAETSRSLAMGAATSRRPRRARLASFAHVPGIARLAAMAHVPGIARLAAMAHRSGLSLAVEELRRIVRMPLLISLPLAFVVLNGALIFGNSWLFPHMAEVAAVAQRAGVRMDEGFLDAVAARPASGIRDQLASSVTHAQGIVADFDAGRAGAAAAGAMDAPLTSRLMASKYAAWEDRVDAVRASGREWDVYGATYTFDVHRFIFGTLVPVVILEAFAAGAAALLALCELDERTGARSIVLSTPIGRGVVATRFIASLMWALGAYVVLGVLAFGAVAVLSGWGIGPAWESSVSSLFNVVVDGGSARPFVTWLDCSVGAYLMWSLLLGSGFVTLLCLTVQAVLLACRYSAIRAAAISCALLIAPLGAQAACALNGWNTARALMHVFPVPLLAVSGQWFTDLGLRTLIPWQEVFVAFGGIAVLWCVHTVLRRAWLEKDVI